MRTQHCLMMAAKRKWQEGQSIFEFVVFLPFMLVLYSILMTVGNSINSSINQQKVVRGYYFNILHGDSSLPSKIYLDSIRANSREIRSTGILAIGWREKNAGGGGAVQIPQASCYRMLPLSTKEMKLKSSGQSETCEASIDINTDGPKTHFVRVKTVFGICGETYATIGNSQYMPANNSPNFQVLSASYAACLNTQ
jgi:hypothetical protein